MTRFNRNDTNTIKGIAVIMMMIHHIMAKPDKLPKDISFYRLLTLSSGRSIERIFADYCQVSICIFTFLAGYGLYSRYRETVEYRLGKRLCNLYIDYWIVFLIFIPIGYLLCRNQPTYASADWICHIFDKVGIKGIISNFISFENTLNIEWWFIPYYAILLICGYFYTRYTKNKGFLGEIVVLFITGIFLVYILPSLEKIELLTSLASSRLYNIIVPYDKGICGCLFICGMVFAKYDKLNYLLQCCQRIKRPFLLIACVFIWTLIIASRDRILPRCFDIISVPITCIVLKFLTDKIGFLNRGIQLIGDNSIWIWLIHSFYCYYFYGIVKIVFLTRYLWVDLVILLSLSIFTAWILDIIWRVVDRLIIRYVIKPEASTS